MANKEIVNFVTGIRRLFKDIGGGNHADVMSLDDLTLGSINSPFVADGTIAYPNGDNVVDATKTAIVTSGGFTQTLTFNAEGKLLAASAVVPV